MADLATGEIVSNVIEAAVDESHAKVPYGVPIPGDDDRQDAGFRWAPEDVQHRHAEAMDRLEREAAAARRDNERLRSQIEAERGETLSALGETEALRAALRDASLRAADCRARSAAADAGRAAAEARAASARAEASRVRERTTRIRGDAAAVSELARTKDAKALRLQADLDTLRRRHDALLDSTVLAAGGGRVAQALVARSNIGAASKPLEKVVKPPKQDDVAALLSRVGALEGQVLSLRTAKRVEADKTRPRPPPPSDPNRPVPASKALDALSIVVGEQTNTETDRLRAENERLRAEMAALRGGAAVALPPPAEPSPPRRQRPAGYFAESDSDDGGPDADEGVVLPPHDGERPWAAAATPAVVAPAAPAVTPAEPAPAPPKTRAAGMPPVVTPGDTVLVAGTLPAVVEQEPPPAKASAPAAEPPVAEEAASAPAPAEGVASGTEPTAAEAPATAEAPPAPVPASAAPAPTPTPTKKKKSLWGSLRSAVKASPKKASPKKPPAAEKPAPASVAKAEESAPASEPPAPTEKASAAEAPTPTTEPLAAKEAASAPATAPAPTEGSAPADEPFAEKAPAPVAAAPTTTPKKKKSLWGALRGAVKSSPKKSPARAQSLDAAPTPPKAAAPARSRSLDDAPAAPAPAPSAVLAATPAAAPDAPTPAVAPAAAPTADHRAKLVAFYEMHNPAKLDPVDATLAKYAGREAELFEKLRAKYEAPRAPVPEAKGEPVAPAPATKAALPAAPAPKRVPPIAVVPPSPAGTPKKKTSMWGKLRGSVRSPKTPKTPKPTPPPDKLQAAARRRSAPPVDVEAPVAAPDAPAAAIAQATTASAPEAAKAVDEAPATAPAEASATVKASEEAVGEKAPVTAQEAAKAAPVAETADGEAPTTEDPPPPPSAASSPFVEAIAKRREAQEADDYPSDVSLTRTLSESPQTPEPKSRRTQDEKVGRPYRPDPTPSPDTPFAARRRSMGDDLTPRRRSRFLRRDDSFTFDPGDCNSPRRRHSALLGQMRELLLDSPVGSRAGSRLGSRQSSDRSMFGDK